VSKADKVAQLRRAERQGRNDSVKVGTLAETFAEQSKPGIDESTVRRVAASSLAATAVATWRGGYGRGVS
jgi:predicted nucleic acid-binding Zn ribbon protein